MTCTGTVYFSTEAVLITYIHVTGIFLYTIHTYPLSNRKIELLYA